MERKKCEDQERSAPEQQRCFSMVQVTLSISVAVEKWAATARNSVEIKGG